MADPQPAPAPAGPEEEASFTSSHTSNFPTMLRALGISLVVSTYQAGRLIFLRAEGDILNTHFRIFNTPMGIAYQPDSGKLAVGTKHELCLFRNQPAVAATLEGAERHDAAFLPRVTYHSGDIQIHEIAWLGEEIWGLNTRFSCLCTFDSEHSFVPRWRPPFVSGLAPEDRCHLNGMAVVDGRVRYATCLGASDVQGGWRERKRDGGLLLEVPSGEAIVTGLSMPHSPRYYDGRLWVLESGRGAISVVDAESGRAEPIAQLPGFTRGLDFYANLAFIGLSQVRETAVFSGIPLVEEIEERACGVWVVDIRDGRTVAFLRFEGIVQEIFAVQVLPGILYPDLVNERGHALSSSFVLPDEALADVPAPLRS